MKSGLAFRRCSPRHHSSAEAVGECAVILSRWCLILSLLIPLLWSLQPACAQPNPVQNSSSKLNEGQPPPTVNQPTSPGPIDAGDSLIPDFYLASVDIDAIVVGERVNMEAVIEVVLNRDLGWQRVPLRFDQAQIWSREYSGPGEEAPDFRPVPGDDGIYWMLKGKGKHRLQFKMWTPVRSSIIGTRLQFTLPPLPNQFVTSLRLTVPESNAILRASPNLTIQDVSRDAEKTIFTASVSKNRLDAIWTVPQANTQQVSKVSTRFHLKPSPEFLLLVADQTIDLQQQDTKALFVKLPSEFQLSIAESMQNFYQTIPSRPGWVKVNLKDPTAGKVELRWEFRKPIAKSGDRVVIDGLEIEGAVQEGGSLRIDDLEGYRILPQLSDSRLVYRVQPEEQAAAKSSSNSAYEFLQQPFRFVAEIRPVEPLHSVTVIHEIHFGLDAITLAVHQLIEVERGTVSQVAMKWPNYQQDGWKFLRSTTSSITSGDVSTTTSETSDEILLRLPAPLSSGERVHLISRFSRSISLIEVGEIEWTVPQISRDYLRGELAITDYDDNLEVELSKNTIANLTPIANANHLTELSEMWNLSRPFTLILNSDKTALIEGGKANPFNATITQHQRTVSAVTLVEIQAATPRDLLINQRFDLNIAYGRLQSLEFLIPPELMKVIQPANVAIGMTVIFEGEAIPLNTIGGIPRLIFPHPIIGGHSLDVQYRFPVEVADLKRRLDLPTLSLLESPLQQAACLITPTENVQLVSEGSQWFAAQTSPKGPLWILDLAQEKTFSSIPLLVGGVISDTSQQYLIEQAQIWTQFEEDGRAKTLARYSILSPPTRLFVTFPVNSELRAIVDGERLPESSISRSRNDSGQVVFNLPDGIRENRVIEFQYLTKSDSKFSLTEQQTFHFPQFPKSVWINETVWELQLPFGFHLFKYPRLKPLFGWERTGLVWERTPDSTYLRERSDLEDEIPETYRFDQNYYAFRGFSPVDSVTFRSMNRSLILLIGAGFALSLGFIFYRFPITRNVFSLVVLAFVFAVASVWYLEPMLLLLQPAVIGVILALTATIIDVKTNRKSRELSTIEVRRTPQTDSRTFHPESVGEGTTRIYTPTTAGGSDLSRD